MTPAFGLVEAKELYPYFVRCSNSVSHLPTHARSLALKLDFPSSNSSQICGTRRSQPRYRVKLRLSMYTLGSAEQRLMRTSEN